MNQRPANFPQMRPGSSGGQRPAGAGIPPQQYPTQAVPRTAATGHQPAVPVIQPENSAPHYKKVIESIDQLPALPAIVAKLIQIVNSPESSADDASRLIEKDPGLTSKMIRLANSAFYGIPRSISSVSSAVVILGFNTIRSLVLSASVMKIFAGSHKTAIDKERFWMHSITTAMAAKTIVRHFINVRMMDPESVFCSGILHDIGKLIFNEYMTDEYLEACKYAEDNKISLYDAETKVLGINHAAIGKIVSDKWSLPIDLEYSLTYHHDPSAADQLQELVATVHYADILAHEMGASLRDNEPLTLINDNYRSILRVTDADHEKIKQALVENIEKSSEFFSIIK